MLTYISIAQNRIIPLLKLRKGYTYTSTSPLGLIACSRVTFTSTLLYLVLC